MAATVDASVDGARAKHNVDVLVQFAHAGVRTTWVIECKHWRSAVPKEKVLALQQVAQDVGADRAFLLSEKGFQAGALHAARMANISLTNLEDLATNASEFLLRVKLQALATRLTRAFDFADVLQPQRNEVAASANDRLAIEVSQDLFLLTITLPHALTDDFPVMLPESPGQLFKHFGEVHNLSDFVTTAERLIENAEARLRAMLEPMRTVLKPVCSALEELEANLERALVGSDRSEEAVARAQHALDVIVFGARELKHVVDIATLRNVRKLLNFLTSTVAGQLRVGAALSTHACQAIRRELNVYKDLLKNV